MTISQPRPLRSRLPSNLLCRQKQNETDEPAESVANLLCLCRLRPRNCLACPVEQRRTTGSHGIAVRDGACNLLSLDNGAVQLRLSLTRRVPSNGAVTEPYVARHIQPGGDVNVLRREPLCSLISRRMRVDDT